MFVTLDTTRFMKYKVEATKAVNSTGNVSDVSADVELIVTTIYTTYDTGNVTTMQNQSYSRRVLIQIQLLPQLFRMLIPIIKFVKICEFPRM